MSEQSYNASDLNSVLQTLSNLTSQTPTQNPTPRQSEVRDVQRHSENHHPRIHEESKSSSSKPSTPGPDPATITTWPAALRYVMRTVDEETQLRIRGLIRSQHSHERQWWNGREALVQRHQARGERKKELDVVLQSIGAPVDSKEISTEKENQAELINYDAKVYKASKQMADALTAELRGLRIPFFAIRQSLIQESTVSDAVQAGHSLEENGSVKVSKSELVNLQRRMLQLLEDLCKE